MLDVKKILVFLTRKSQTSKSNLSTGTILLSEIMSSSYPEIDLYCSEVYEVLCPIHNKTCLEQNLSVMSNSKDANLLDIN